MKLLNTTALLAAVGLVLAGQSARAQNTFYEQGDLTIFFQDSALSNTLMVNLGPATSFRDAAVNSLNFLNINTQLTTAFGAGYFDRASLYFGAAGVFSNDPFDSTVTNGDPTRTSYITKGRLTTGANASLLGTQNSSTPTTGNPNALSSGVLSLTNRLETQSMTISLEEGFSTSNIDNQNPLFASGAQNTAYDNTIAGGTQFRFNQGADMGFGMLGATNFEGAVDLFRIAPTGVGSATATTYEGTLAIDNAGNLSFFVVPEPSSIVLLGLAAGILGTVRRRRSQS